METHTSILLPLCCTHSRTQPKGPGTSVVTRNLLAGLPPGWLKLNFDGSVYENNRAGLGCVIRNHEGIFIAIKGSMNFSRSIDMVEFRRALIGLDFAMTLLATSEGLILEGDSTEAFTRICRILDRAHFEDTELKFARLLKDTPRVIISRVDRTANGDCQRSRRPHC